MKATDWLKEKLGLTSKAEVEAEVTEVIDGDTFVVQSQGYERQIKLENVGVSTKKSKEKLTTLIQGKKVMIHPREKEDGKIVAQVQMKNKNINKLMRR